jgi:hypothetical protein
MTRNILWKMKSTFLRKTILTIAVAGATLALSPSHAFAGATEKAKLEASLGKSIDQATTNELLAAVQNVITANPGLNAGVIAGEALKGANSTTAADFGTELGQRIDNATISVGDVPKFAGKAAKTANTGKLPNGSKVEAFAAAIFANDGDNTAALAAAKVAIGSKSAAGQIIGGRATGKTDAAIEDLLASMLADKSLRSGLQASFQFAGDEADNIRQLAIDVASETGGLKQIKAIAPGAAAGQPVKADDILDGLITNVVTRATTLSLATKLAGSMSVVADTEVVTDMAITFGGELNGGNIKFSKLTSIAKNLTKGLVLKPAIPSQEATHGRDSLVNKLDEIGEVAAYLFNAVASRPEFDSVKKTPALVVKIIKTIIKTAKIKSVPSFQLEAGDDVAGSVAQTIVSLNLQPTSPFAAGVFDAIKAKLLNPKTAKSIGGKNSALVAAISNAFTRAFGLTAGTAYEDGTHPEFLGVELTVPETDLRNG